MIEPPIENLLKTTHNNRFELCVLAGKRAKEIASKIYFDPEAPKGEKKEISQALDEIVVGDVQSSEGA